MAWDIALALLAFHSQFATTYLGWRVTVDGAKSERKKLYEAIFVLGGIVGASSIGIATYRASGIASDLASLKAGQAQTNVGITKIEENTSQPPKVEVTLPKESEHTRIDVVGRVAQPHRVRKNLGGPFLRSLQGWGPFREPLVSSLQNHSNVRSIFFRRFASQLILRLYYVPPS
jgi:hypothetical protein